ncbi:hypothetical protein BDZ90DRAFT_230572 [Jaminaea rosea]|uniref:Uncharacterized protein n=1 Tax=Jaminaea rosea TaxID=1569628 RepID=A0A316UWN6_9BASI|nr:hypothetical protein BDZ90DRAFT_230572 [Jaminaea rosea]PWN29720.1 hypothetical protein BDZ90DRAFT_230572 [Jaminaea rosea]
MASWMSYVHFLAFILALYWIHVGFQALVVRGKRQAFRLEQRRRAGIPDSDNRPFDIAQADALQVKRRRDLARSNTSAVASSFASATGFDARALFGRGLPSSAKKISSALPRSGSASPYSPRRPNVVAPSTSSHLSPGQSSRYNPASYAGAAGRASPAGATAGYKRSIPAANEARSETSTVRPAIRHRPSKLAQLQQDQDEEEEDGETGMAWEATELPTRRGKKRGADEARNIGEEDSVIGRAGRAKKGRAYQPTEIGSAMDEDDNEYLPGEGEEANDSETDLASLGPLSELDDEEMDEYAPPQRTPAGLLPSTRRAKHKAARKIRQPRTIKAEPKDRSLADDMRDLSDVDDDVSMRTTSRAGRNKAATTSRDVPDSERSIGEEWHDPVSNFQHRMDLDDVLTDEEVTPGRKRRVTKQRRVKRRLTVKLEWRPKWAMPADSEHPDKGEMVPHYVPVWLSDAEIDESRRKGELGEQVGERELQARRAAEAKAAAGAGSASSSPSSARRVDSLLYQAPHRIPLRSPLSKSKLGLVGASPRTSPGLTRSRSATPDVSLGGTSRGSPAATSTSASSSSSRTNSRGRLSLGGSPSSLSTAAAAGATGATASPLRNRALDAAGKRRREEELMKRIREAREDKERLEREKKEKEAKAKGPAPPAAAPVATPTPSFGTAPVASKAEDGPKQPGEADAGKAPFSFGAPATAAPSDPAKPAAPAPASSGGFTFGAPSSSSAAPPPQPQTKTESKPSQPSSSSPFTFGAAAKPAAPAAPAASSSPAPFTFGDSKPAAATSTATTSAQANGTGGSTSPAPFSFGKSAAAASPAPAANGSSSSSTPFSFGAPSSNGPASKPADSASGGSGAPSFTFGASSSASPAPAAPASSSAPFSFGASKTSTPSGPSSGTGGTSFTFGAPAAPAAGGSGSGTTSGGFSFSFGKK